VNGSITERVRPATAKLEGGAIATLFLLNEAPLAFGCASDITLRRAHSLWSPPLGASLHEQTLIADRDFHWLEATGGLEASVRSPVLVNGLRCLSVVDTIVFLIAFMRS
jgi:hypothetical protein